MKNIILVDCKSDELYDFMSGLEDTTNEKWEIKEYISNFGRKSTWQKIKRYLIYFYAPFMIFIKRKNYKNIVGWQQFYTLIFCYFCKIFHVKKKFNVYIVNFTYKEKKGFIGKIYYKFMKSMVNNKYVDYIFVLSEQYIEYCHNKLDVPTSKFVVLHFGIPDRWKNYQSFSKENNYALSIGRSNRDYDWLIDNWDSIDYPLYIISDTYKPKRKLKDNIKLFDNISGNEQFPYIANSRFVILPIKEPEICSGDTVLLTAMSFEKPVLVTYPSTLSEMYIENGKNGYIIDKQNDSLKEFVDKIVNNKKDIGKNARDSYLKNYSRYNMGCKIGKTIKKINN